VAQGGYSLAFDEAMIELVCEALVRVTRDVHLERIQPSPAVTVISVRKRIYTCYLFSVLLGKLPLTAIREAGLPISSKQPAALFIQFFYEAIKLLEKMLSSAKLRNTFKQYGKYASGNRV